MEKSDLLLETDSVERDRLKQTMPPPMIFEINDNEADLDGVSQEQKEILKALDYIDLTGPTAPERCAPETRARLHKLGGTASLLGVPPRRYCDQFLASL
jgi:hypothetical protein